MEDLKKQVAQIAQDIVNTHGSYKKEPKRYGKNRERLVNWGNKIQDLWELYKTKYEELTALDDPENETDSNESEYNDTKLYYDDMSTNIQFKLSRCKGKNQLNVAFDSPTIIRANEQKEEATEPVVIEESESESDLEFKTPMKKILRKPRALLQSPELQEHVKTATDRFENKAKLFGRELEKIDEHLKDGLKTRARLAVKDIEKLRNDLSECIEEVYFMLGDDASEYEEIYDALVQQYREIIENTSEIERMEVTTAPLRLKPIEIPTFTGNAKQWPTFSGLFRSMIIKNKALTEVQKMQYLKTTVSGEPANLIANMGIMDDKFDAAWNILCDRFENKRAIREAHLELLLKIPEMRFEASHELRKYYDKGKECIELLNEVSAEQILLYLLMKKLPNETRKVYEQSRVNPTEEQKLTEYFEFLHKRCQVLETIEGNFRNENKKMTKEKCAHCNENHAVFMCNKFKALSVSERREVVKQKELCLLCLRNSPKHTANQCKFKKMCPQCNKPHNGLMHFDNNEKNEKKFDKQNTKEQHKKSYFATTNNNEIVCATAHDVNSVNTLLATALIRVKTWCGWSDTIRVLIDQGSMTSFINANTVKLLKLKQTKNNINICGIAGSVEAAKGTVSIQIGSRYPTSFKANVTAIVMNKLTTLLPHNDFEKSIVSTSETDELIMADPDFNKPAKIDMILGADVYSEIILSGMIKAADKSFVLQETELGWIISGPVNKNRQQFNQALCMVSSVGEIDEKLQKFWENEEIFDEEILTADEQRCVEHFNNTIRRDDQGAYVVSLPFKGDPSTLGDSRRMAMAQLFQMERKFEKNQALKEAYTAYMNELIKKGYMTRCSHDSTKPHCYLPHHPVLKDSTTTKVRPVFDASRKTANGISLNDLLIPGPKLQEDLFNILLRFRTHKIAFTADIEKMYLHVKLEEEDQVFQKILWRENVDDPILEYCLTTVTFGVNISPFLAVATVQHHAKNEMINFPEACNIISNDSYMDDVSSGTHDVETAIQVRKQITHVLQKAEFPLRKWASNSEELLASIPENEKEMTFKELNGLKYVTTLGLRWFCDGDKLGFKANIERNATKLTKRSILSQITTIFDPLGLLSPVTIYNKILMQDIWREQINWDDQVSEEVATKWHALKEQLPLIEKIKVQRWLKCKPGSKIELHGFSDASEAAMGACVYMKVYEDDEIHVNLVAAKTKVAPMKKITLPKLELCAAVLLAKLMKSVKKSLKINISATHFYSDSEITLAWIKGDVSRWKTFVANRVSRIHELSEKEQWHYINTKANPADFASRGLLPHQLKDNTLWWYGPSVLLNEENCSDNIYNIKPFKTDLEKKKQKTQTFHVSIDTECITKYSTLTRAVRVIAFCNRYINKLKTKREVKTLLSTDEAKEASKKQVLDADELNEAKIQLIKMFQAKYFEKDIRKLHEKQLLSKESRLTSLNPFLDDKNILRVGGRLQNSEFSYNKKHPIIIPYGCHLMRLIINEAHMKTMHGGNQLTLCQIRHEYWITAAKRAVKTFINNCVVCHRLKKQNAWQLMGNLPAPRTKIVQKAFTHTGTDLCGPIYLRMMSGRGVKTQKGYIVIFICFATRAIHIEIVVDLTAESFIAAFRRLVGRRGHVSHLYCDNGTNFVGANNILQLESEQAINDFNDEIKENLAMIATRFHFNPSISPWMGGLWERGVGSIKYHLKRTVGDKILTYEELSTVLIQIEAILNSRPMTPLTENADDLDILTPGHFLVGNALTAPVEPNLCEIKENRLSRWQLCTKMKQEFWTKWSNDYITQLQLRNKWKNQQDNLEVGDMVLLKEENTAPLNWPLGRIKKIYPGKDGLVRVVEVAAKNKIYKRPIVKLSKLPLKDAEFEKLKRTESLQEEEKTSHQEAPNDANIKKTSATKTKSNAISDKPLHKTNHHKKNEKKHPKRKYTGKAILCAFIAVLTFFSLTPNVNASQSFEIMPFEKMTGIKFSTCKNVAFINGNWNLILYMDLHEYDKDLETLQQNVNHIEKHCKKSNNSDCQSMADEIFKKMHEIMMLDEVIKTKTNKHEKRGAFWYSLLGSTVGFLGEKIASKIFGENEDQTNQILKQQISVLKVMNREMIAMENSSKEHLLISYALLATLEFHSKQTEILKSITQGNARLTPDLVTPDVLAQQIQNLKEKLPKKTRLIGDEVLDVYKFAETKTWATSEAIVTVAEIPLVDDYEYECMKATPIPFMHEGHYIEPVLENDYIWYNNDTAHLASREEEKKCIDHQNIRYCELNGPLLLREKANECTYNLFINKTESNCKYRATKTEEWIEIEPNQWMYNVRKEEKIKIKCNDKLSQVYINGSGILTLHDKCEIQTEMYKIKTRNQITTKSNEEIKMQLHEIIVPAGSNIMHIDVKREIESLTTRDDMLMMHHWHHYIWIYIIIIALLNIIVYFYSKLELGPEP